MTQGEAATALSAAVAQAYNVFSGYRPGSQLATCRCSMCMDDHTEHLLLTTPLREIQHETLCEYTWSANGLDEPKFNADELRYFLPRYFEFIAGGEWPAFSDPEPTLRQLGTLNYRANWPALEVATVDQFFAALFHSALAKPLSWNKSELGDALAWSTVEETLCCIAHGGGDMTSLLAAWDHSASPFADDHRAALAASCDDEEEHGLWSPFWSNQLQDAKIVALWIRRPETIERLQCALSKLPPGKRAALHASAIKNVEQLTTEPNAR
ncbi:MAG: hypothetical protein HOP09_07390 [Hyphomicrobium sp.]|nr:hypothetical protein [Hyphomicrobium sp.]